MATPLGEKIKALRWRQSPRVSLDTLAAATQISKSYLWELENRELASPSAEKLAAIANYFSVPVDYFFEADVSEPEERHLDEAFFRNYKQLESEDKEKLRKILDAFRKS